MSGSVEKQLGSGSGLLFLADPVSMNTYGSETLKKTLPVPTALISSFRPFCCKREPVRTTTGKGELIMFIFF